MAERTARAQYSGPRATPTPKAPAHLKADGVAFWTATLAGYELHDSHELARLQVAAECLDRIAECRARIEADGMFQEGRYGTKMHVAAVLEDRQRSQFLKAVRELGLDLAEAQTPRLPSRWR